MRIATKRNAAERELDGASDLDGLEEDYFFFAFLAGFAAFFAAFFATFLAILASPDCGRCEHHAQSQKCQSSRRKMLKSLSSKTKRGASMMMRFSALYKGKTHVSR
ncbi:MAG: hypothetical protein WDM79_14070 [Terricaulis sp.]